MRVDTKICARPKCTEPNCNNTAHIIKSHGNGIISFRKWCRLHHNLRTGEKYNVNTILEVMALKENLTVREYLNSKHPYRQFRKDYCENRDGRVGGFKCVAVIPWTGILQVDHIDGNPINNDLSNLQTLCANCHTLKSHLNADYKTPGRKALRNQSKQKSSQ